LNPQCRVDDVNEKNVRLKKRKEEEESKEKKV